MPFLNMLSTCYFAAVSRDNIPLVTVISLSIAAVIISSAIYGCYAKYVMQTKDCLCLVSVNEL